MNIPSFLAEIGTRSFSSGLVACICMLKNSISPCTRSMLHALHSTKSSNSKNAITVSVIFRLRANGLLRPCWQWCENGCNNSQQCWDLQCIVERIQPTSLCKPCVMSMRGPHNVRGAVQTDPTLLCYASAITEQKKCWELLAEKFDRFQTLRNNTQQHPTTCNRVCKRT